MEHNETILSFASITNIDWRGTFTRCLDTIDISDETTWPEASLAKYILLFSPSTVNYGF